MNESLLIYLQGYFLNVVSLTQINKDDCRKTNKHFFYFDNAHLKKYVIKKSNFKHD